MKWFFFLKVALFFFSTSLFSEEVVVDLYAKEKQLAPLYLSFFSQGEADFCKKIESVLRFDLSHNGKTNLVHTNAQNEIAAKEKDLFSFDEKKWLLSGVSYVIKAKLEDKKLSASVFSTSDKKLKVIENLNLCGEIAKDRRVIHKLADAIFETLFKEKGVASTKILYTVRTKKEADPSKWVSEVWQADYDGENAKKVTQDNALAITPVFLPFKEGSSSRFLYVSYKIGQPKIFASSLDGVLPKRMTLLKGNQLMPAISKTGDKIAFISDVAGNPDLFIADFSPEKGVLGKPRQIFSSPQGAQGCPTFGPDGEKIAFVSNKDGTPRIYILDTDLKNPNPRLISRKTRENTSPSWSSDGKKIAYSAMVQGVRQIWIYDLQKNEEFQLTEGKEHKENPVWAPNSLHLLYNTSTEKESELYLIDLNQKKAVKIGKGSGEKRFPSWEQF